MINKLIDNLIESGYLKSEAVIDAFRKIDRAKFVSEDLENSSYADMPLPIGYGQTISQPLTVAFMLELLEARVEDNVLDVGSGSGWTTALLAHIVGKKGKVIALEYIKNIFEIGAENIEKFHFIRDEIVEVHLSDGRKGFERHAPYDRILVSAESKDFPEELKKQLKIGGKMVIPVNKSIWLLEKKSENEFEEKEFPGFAFVPLVKGR